MRNIKLVDDLGAPAVVTIVNVAARASTFTVGTMPVADIATYVMFVGGYVGAYMGWGGNFVKNIGIAAAPLAFEKIYDRVKGVQARGGVAMRRVSRYPAPEQQAPFNGVRLV